VTLVWDLVVYWLVATGILGFFMMGIDKARAKDGSWRIPERAFYMLALIGGAFGIAVGSSLFHHKTSKDRFLGYILIACLAWAAILHELRLLAGP